MQYTKEFIQEKLATDKRWLERGILAIWKFQTTSEKKMCDTHLFNGVGFNGADGRFMTSLGNILNRGYHLTEKQVYVARKKMKKYAGQLVKIINEKEKWKGFTKSPSSVIAKMTEAERKQLLENFYGKDAAEIARQQDNALAIMIDRSGSMEGN